MPGVSGDMHLTSESSLDSPDYIEGMKCLRNYIFNFNKAFYEKNLDNCNPCTSSVKLLSKQMDEALIRLRCGTISLERTRLKVMAWAHHVSKEIERYGSGPRPGN